MNDLRTSDLFSAKYTVTFRLSFIYLISFILCHSRLRFPLSRKRSQRRCESLWNAQLDGIYRVPVDECN